MTTNDGREGETLDDMLDGFAADCGDLTLNAPANVAKLRKACGGSKPSAGHSLVDEVCGLLRVAQGQRDAAEARARKAEQEGNARAGTSSLFIEAVAAYVRAREEPADAGERLWRFSELKDALKRETQREKQLGQGKAGPIPYARCGTVANGAGPMGGQGQAGEGDVERVARTIVDTDLGSGTYDEMADEHRPHWRLIARAAIAALGAGERRAEGM